MEDSIRQPDILKSVQRFQLAVDEAKVRLNLAISPGTWLMASNLLINTQSTIGYNNKLKKVTSEMKLGVNNTINSDTKSVGIKSMDGGKSKTKRLTGDGQGDSGDAKVNISSLEQETISVAAKATTNHEVTK